MSSPPQSPLSKTYTKSNFLSPPNKLAFLQNDKIVFNKNNLADIVLQAVNEDETRKSLPVAIIAVLGSDLKGDRKMFTNWIIDHHENSQETFVSSALDYFGNFENSLNDGIYIWPKPYKLVQKPPSKTKELLCWILYLEDNHQLDLFAACASSKIVIFKTPEKENFIALFRATEHITRFWANTNCIDSSSELLRFSQQPNIRQLGTRFLENYQKREIEPKRNSDGVKVTLENFVSHIEHVVQLLNKHKVPLPDTKSSFKREAPPIPGSPTQEKLSSGPPEETLVENNGEPMQINDEITEENIDGMKRENEKPDVNPAEQLDEWIENSMNIKNLDKLIDFAATLSHNQDSSLKTGLRIRDIIESFNSDLRNMFDNYICFHGKDDENKMTKFSALAKRRLEESITKSYANLSECPIKIASIQKIQEKLNYIYQNDNSEIVESETKLCDAGAKKILLAYPVAVLAAHKKLGIKLTVSDLELVHRKTLQQAVAALSRCMDHGGRLNMVLMRATDKLKFDVEESFKKLVSTIIVRPALEMPLGEEINIRSYLAKMSELEQYLNMYTDQELIDFHNVWKERFNRNMKSKVKADECKFLLDSYLIFLLEKRWELIEKSIIDETLLGQQRHNENTLVIHITPTWFRLAAKIEHESKMINFPNRKQMVDKAPARVAWKDPDQLYFGYELENLEKTNKLNGLELHDNLLSLITNEATSMETKIKILKSLLAYFKHLSEEQIGDRTEFFQAIVVIPSVFTKENRKLLRECAKDAKFQRILIWNESSLLAYHKIGEQHCNLLAVMNIRLTGVRVEIFEKGTSRKEDEHVIRMIGLAVGEWNANNTNHNQSPGNFLPIMQDTYERVLNQLLAPNKNGKMPCGVICENLNWHKSLEPFFNISRKDIFQVDVSDEVIEALNAALEFGANPYKLRNLILDHAGYVLENYDLNVDPEQGKSVISANRQGILQKCNLVLDQLENGEIKVGVLRKKIILEVVNRTRDSVLLDLPYENEEVELNELISQHNLKTKM